jgi:hypothetical protein
MPSPRRTRSTNAMQHPGLVAKAKKHHSPEEVKAAKEAKVMAKEAKKEAKIASINRAAEFESNAMANEDFMDATPQPNFNPRPSTPTETISETETDIDINMSDRPDLDKHAYIPPEDPTEDDTMGSEGFAEETPMPLSKKRKAAPKATKQVSLTCSFAVADLAAEAPPKHGQPKSHDNTKRRQPKSKAADDDTSPVNLVEDSATESDDQPLPPPMKKARAKKAAKQSVEVINRSATRGDGAPASKKGKIGEEVGDKKTKKKKESICDAIEAAQGKMPGINSDSRNPLSVDNPLRSKLDTSGKKLEGKADMKSKLKSKPKSGPKHFGPQWVPKRSDGSKGKEEGGVGKCTTDVSKDRASIKGSNQVVIDIGSDDDQVPAKTMM